jgi:hypothetical protein
MNKEAVNVALPFIIDRPLGFEHDPHTGLLHVTAQASGSHPTGSVEINLELLLTPAASKALLASLPQIEALLRQASLGPVKPGSLQ